MEYRDPREGEHWASARRAPDPRDRFSERPPADPNAGGGGPRVPGQRAHGYDDEFPAPHVPPADPAWTDGPPTSGRHRQPDRSGEAIPNPRSGTRRPTEGGWQPTLDPTDWRYATDDVGYPYGPAAWEDDRGPGDRDRGSADRDRGSADRDRGSGEHTDPYGGNYPGGWDPPDSRQRQMYDATEVLGEPIRDDGEVTGRPGTPPGGWARGADPGQWRRSTESGPWSPDVTGHWELPSDTGQWEQFGDTEWPGGRPGGPDTAEPVGPPDAPYRQDRPGAFWSGIRLAGDDPRWTTTPSTAPHSPAVFLPDGTAVPTGEAPGAAPPIRDAGPEPDDGGGASGGVVTAVLFTVAWYVVPALVLLAWILTLDASPPQDCAIDAAQSCESARAQAAAAVVDSGARAAIALGASLVTAVLLRLATNWRAASVGLAAAVIGGGLSTLLISVITGQPLN